MLWGTYNTHLIAPGGPAITERLVGGHARFGVIGILSNVLGSAVDYYGVAGRGGRS